MSKPLTKTPPPVKLSRLRAWLMGMTMLTPVARNDLLTHLWFADQGVSFS